MTELVFTPSPSVEGFASLVLSDGDRELELIETVLMNRVFLAELDMPVVTDEDTYATSPDMQGSTRVRSKPNNAEGGGRLWARATADDVLWELVDDLQDLAANAHRRKGTLTYTPPGGTAVTYQLESFHLTVQTHTGLDLGQHRMALEFAFTCRPYGLLEEETLLSGVTFTGPIDYTLIETVPGHVDAYGTLTVTDAEGEVRDDIEWGITDDFDPDDAYEIPASELDLTGYSGTFDTNHVEGIAQSDWLAICATEALTHTGRYRVKVRLRGTTASACEVRVAKRNGNGPWETNFDNLAIPSLDDVLVECDVGIVDIRRVSEGTHSWNLQIQARGDASQLDIYSVLLIPAGRYGRARAPAFGLAATPTIYDAYDSFDQAVTGGTDPLDGKTSASGDTWNTDGDATDFEVEDTFHTAYRSATADASIYAGRAGALGSAVSATAARVDVKFSGLPAAGTGLLLGVVARYADPDNLLVFALNPGSPGSGGNVFLFKVVGGSSSIIAPTLSTSGNPLFSGTNIAYNLAVSVDVLGNYTCFLAGAVAFKGTDSDLAAGGDLASGQAGIYDAYTGGGGIVRTYDNFACWTPPVDHVIYSDAPMQVDQSTAQRRRATIWGDVPSYEGKRMLLPPATRNDYTARLVIKQDRNDLAELPVADSGDELTVDLTCRGRVLLTTT